MINRYLRNLISHRLSTSGQERGFTLLETLVALSLFAIVSVSMLPAFIGHLKINQRSELKTGAIQAAQIVLEELRLENPETLPQLGQIENLSVPSAERIYAVEVVYCGVTTHCTTRSRQVDLTVRYQNEVLYEISTVFTRLR